MKMRIFSPAKLSYANISHRTSNKTETRYYCDMCHGEVGEAEGKELSDGRFVHKRHKI